jgi:ATP/maltotriose-dependent transcriptional regulator MalT
MVKRGPDEQAEELVARAVAAWATCLEWARASRMAVSAAAERLSAVVKDDLWAHPDLAAIAERDKAASLAAEAAERWELAARKLLEITATAFGSSTPARVIDLMRAVFREADEDVYKRLAEDQFAAEILARAADASGDSLDEALNDWNIPTDTRHRDGLMHVLMRSPRGSTIRRWRRVMQESKHKGFMRWLYTATRQCVNDEERRGPPMRPMLEALEPADRDRKLLEILESARARGSSDREIQVLEASLRGESSAETGARLGCAAGTVRFHRHHVFRRLDSDPESSPIRRGWEWPVPEDLPED